jgi:nucleolar protein 4
LSKKPILIAEVEARENEEIGTIESAEKEQVVKAKKDKKEQGIHSKSTLFVSTLPFSTTATELETFFSEIGPLKSCFIIKNKATQKHSGCGYVQYALATDAIRAITELKKKKFKNLRTLKIIPAIRKSIVLERREKNIPLNIESKQKELEKIIERKNKMLKPLGKDNETQRLLNSVSVQISGLPQVLKSVLYKKVRKFGNVKELIVLNEALDEFKQETLKENEAKVVYEFKEEAQKAVKHLHEHIYKGKKIQCKLVETITVASLAKKARLIIRNLAFHCKPDSLEKVFEVYGELVEVKVPLRDGKARGFGFVQFKTVEDAQKAIDQVNGSMILNRPVAVDWALGKAQFDRIVKEVEESDEEVEDEGVSSDEDEAIIDEVDEIEVEKEQDDSVDVESCTIFVRNLSFDTTKTALYKWYYIFN